MGERKKHHLMQSKSDSNVNQKRGMITEAIWLLWAAASLSLGKWYVQCCCWQDKRNICVIHHLLHIIIGSFSPPAWMTLYGIFKEGWISIPGFVCEPSDGVLHVSHVTWDSAFGANVGNWDRSLYWIWIKKSIWMEELSCVMTLSLTCTLTPPIPVSYPVISCSFFQFHYLISKFLAQSFRQRLLYETGLKYSTILTDICITVNPVTSCVLTNVLHLIFYCAQRDTHIHTPKILILSAKSGHYVSSSKLQKACLNVKTWF